MRRATTDFASRISHPPIQADSNPDLTAEYQSKTGIKPTRPGQPRTQVTTSPTPTFRLCSNERQPKNQHNLAYKPHIRRCKRYFAGIAARAGSWHNKTARRSARREVERATGIEPASEAWEASILPMNYARNSSSQRNRPVDHSLTADGRATGASRPTIRHAPAESFWPRAPQAGPPLTVERQVQRAHPPARRSPLPPSPCPRPSAPVRRCPARIH